MYLIKFRNKIKLLVFILILVSVLSVSKAREQSHRNRRSALRIKRQTQLRATEQLIQSAGNSNSNQSPKLPPNDSNTQDGGSSNTQENPNQEEKAPEEILTSLKCDFGTSEAPDMCKFKLIDSLNPLSKGANTWTHGSGKLALFQGGPLMDASDRNDTTGGYIFYETSNPYSTNQSSHTGLSGPNMNFENSSGELYSGLASAGGSSRNRKNNMNKDQEAFQRLTSARISVGASGGSSAPGFVSANLSAPGPSGMCLSFKYAIQGLSADELRIHVNDHKTEKSRQIWASSESAGSNWTRGEVLYSVTNVHSITFSGSSGGAGMPPKDGQQRKFRGYLALDDIEVNKHDSSGETSAACRGHCNFDGDLCGWTNSENGLEDDFDWSFGRGSDNLFTGPARDYISSANNDLTGSYLYTDSSYPRRPGDRAVLVSPMFPATPKDDAMCMHLAIHMFGSGVGSLAVKLRYAEAEAAARPPSQGTNQQQQGASSSGSSSQQAANMMPGNMQAQTSPSSPLGKSPEEANNNDVTIWEMSGDAGNSWHQAQTSVSSSKGPFQVVIEGSIGENHLGNIAIDEISFSSGPCPTSPPVASKNVGDCTFEQSMCYWRNPDTEMHLDDLDWVRSSEEQSIHGPNFDHTLKRRSGSYLKLENTFKEPKSGSRAFLLSPIFQAKASNNVQCLSFYYYMFMRSISPSGPNLGTIRVYLASNSELVPIWRLTNPISSPSWKHARASLSTSMIDGEPQAPSKMFQIAFEGIWGDAPAGAIALDDITVFDGACDIMPPEAKSVSGECSFDVDLCSWINKTSSSGASNQEAGDSAGSPFLQSVSNQAVGGVYPAVSFHQQQSRLSRWPASWQLATIDSRPVNLQDHTYKAPIGYVYVDVLEGDFAGEGSRSRRQTSYVLQSTEFSLQQGQQVVQCLSFWFAGFGRQDSNQLSVHLTQASLDATINSESSAPSGSQSVGNQTNQDEGSENTGAWKMADGKMLWSLSLHNLTEVARRKWQYAQTTLRANSNYIVRFAAQANDGGFALDDISYYEGPCETRPSQAKVHNEDGDAPIGNEDESLPGGQSKGSALTSSMKQANQQAPQTSQSSQSKPVGA